MPSVMDCFLRVCASVIVEVMMVVLMGLVRRLVTKVWSILMILMGMRLS